VRFSLSCIRDFFMSFDPLLILPHVKADLSIWKSDYVKWMPFVSSMTEEVWVQFKIVLENDDTRQNHYQVDFGAHKSTFLLTLYIYSYLTYLCPLLFFVHRSQKKLSILQYHLPKPTILLWEAMITMILPIPHPMLSKEDSLTEMCSKISIDCIQMYRYSCFQNSRMSTLPRINLLKR